MRKRRHDIVTATATSRRRAGCSSRARSRASAPTRRSYGLAVLGGGCVLLDSDLACGVHKKRGPEAKPAGCRTYPLRDVKCGDELHIGIAVECRCSIDFAGADRAHLLSEAEVLFARRRQTRIVEEVADTVHAFEAGHARRISGLARRGRRQARQTTSSSGR